VRVTERERERERREPVISQSTDGEVGRERLRHGRGEIVFPSEGRVAERRSRLQTAVGLSEWSECDIVCLLRLLLLREKLLEESCRLRDGDLLVARLGRGELAFIEVEVLSLFSELLLLLELRGSEGLVLIRRVRDFTKLLQLEFILLRDEREGGVRGVMEESRRDR
jgi:hypothetical protein